MRWRWLCCWLFVLECRASVDYWRWPQDDEEDEELEAFEDDEDEDETVPDDGCDLEDADFETDAFA